ncbi:PP2C family protein-serine/threonine phosphatase [Nonomuraea endophytica]|uniref:PP2C family protein-serine/threonine phosphatase n=1 Tax=Nonomuraea endophytica TaxID=714136 RepID=UPI0037C58BFA
MNGKGMHFRLLLAVPVGLIAAITVTDLILPDEVRLGPLLVVAPAITASFAVPMVTAITGVLAVAAQILLGVHDGSLHTQTTQAQVLALAVVSAIVVAFSALRERDQRQLVQIRTVAEAAQRALLRPLPAQAGPLRFASLYLAAAAEAQIGGDLYGASTDNSRTIIVIGDVRGKGLPAVSDAATLLGSFREIVRSHSDLPDLAARLDDSIRADHTSADQREFFVTALLIEMSHDAHTATMLSCGHPPPVLIGRDPAAIRQLTLDTYAPPLGLGDLAPRDYKSATFPFEPGDLLLVYTDGIIEARNPAGVFYPLHDRLPHLRADDPDTLVAALHADLLAYTRGGLDDDLALIAIQRLHN